MSIKINAQKGNGKAVAKRYGVRGFPTLSMVDSSGAEIDRIIGFRPPEKLISEIKPFLEGQSFRAFKKRVAENAADFEAVLGLGKKYELRRDWKKAEELYQRLKAADAPASFHDSAGGRLALIQFYKSRGKEATAVERYFAEHSESDIAVDHARVLFSTYQRKEDSPKVVLVAEYLIRHGSESDANLLNNYSWYLATHDLKLKRALELAKKAVKLSPKAAHIIDTLAEAYYRNGMHDEAVTTQKRAVQLAPDRQRAEFEKRLAKFEEAMKQGKRKKVERF